MIMVGRSALVLAALCTIALGQVATRGQLEPRGTEKAGRFVLPRQDNAVLLSHEDDSHGGFQFAQPVDVKLNSREHGQWTLRPNGILVWKLTIQSPGALSLSVVFDKFLLPELGELYVYNENKLRGAYTWRNNKKHGWFSTAPMDGDEITLEYLQPAFIVEDPEISIFKVAHGYKKLAFGSSGRCNINAVCPEADGWRNQIRGVAMMLTQFGSRYCSGSMINNVAQDGSQYFLTANHCIGSSAPSDQLMFNYESSVCPLNGQVDGPTDMTAAGLTSLATYAGSDFHLLEVEETIPDGWNVYLNGFDANDVVPVTMTGIHHPSGDIKKICFSNQTGVADSWSEAPNKFHWRVPYWDAGTTEPGSSGSPLFNANGLIIGQLHGGAASCGNPMGYDSYGAVWASWDKGTQKLNAYLDPRGTGTRAVRGMDLSLARAH